MVRFIYVIIMRIGSIVYYVPRMRKYAHHPERYTDEDRHRMVREMIAKVAKTARITTYIYGEEHLPKEGGYIMYANHQGKWDALGIMEGLCRPCRVLMDKKRSKMPVANEFVSLIHGKRMDRNSIRQQVKCLREITEEVKAGSVYLIFPEGGYEKGQTNRMGHFYNGCFASAMEAGCPVVPVALVDSYKPFGRNSLKRVETAVYFLQPITYETYKDMTRAQLAALVQERISEQLRAVVGETEAVA